MNGNYWLVETKGSEGPEFGCVYAFSASDAAASAELLYGRGNVGKEPEPIELEWFHYEPVLAVSRNIGGRKAVSLKEQFFAGGRIGCESGGIEFMFTPDLLPEPRETGEGDDATVIYGNALLRVKGRPDLDMSIELEGLDDAHLVDRLSGEAVRVIGKARSPKPEVAVAPSRVG